MLASLHMHIACGTFGQGMRCLWVEAKLLIEYYAQVHALGRGADGVVAERE
jgi:hypothetical protein